MAWVYDDSESDFTDFSDEDNLLDDLPNPDVAPTKKWDAFQVIFLTISLISMYKTNFLCSRAYIFLKAL